MAAIQIPGLFNRSSKLMKCPPISKYMCLFTLLPHRRVAAVNCKRTFLSEAYKCQDSWQRRLDSALIKNIRIEDYYFELDRKFQHGIPPSSVDVDLFVNKVSDKDQLHELEDVVHRFRRSINTCRTLPSTHYATIKAFLDLGESEDILRILNDRLNYGIFPNHHAYNLLMDTFQRSGKSAAAAQIASFMMLQEELDHPIAHPYALYSCLQYLKDPSSGWYTEPIVEDTSEEELVRVQFLRNPFWDDHFDLVEPNHLVGKTLAMLSMNRDDAPIWRTTEMLGWALFEKWDKVKTLLQNKKLLMKDGVTYIEELLNKVPEKNAEIAKECLELLSKSKNEKLVSEESIFDLATNQLKMAIKDHEIQDIGKQEFAFEAWAVQRQETIDKQVAEFIRQERITKIEEKKQEIATKEEILFFFENEEKILMQNEKPRPKVSVTKLFQKESDKVDEAYIPPDVEKPLG